ncbi:MAG: ParB/RepB/Spo0J family partition protein [Candidatus Cloacimonetes bacterium]|nr:ParB/RepB/Spo0J family partition protein [Candidatus Cloacimonadota bacterium]
MNKSKGGFLNPEKKNSPMDEFFDNSNDIMTLDINEIKMNPYQPRKIFDEDSLLDLSNSIKHSGLIQPIIVRISEDNSYTLVAGERRLRACKMADMHTIRAIITKEDPLEVSIIENLQRENLKPVEEAEALAQMIKNYNYTQKNLAIAIGKKESTISEILSINRIPDHLKEKVRRAELSKRVLIEVAKQETSEKMGLLIDKILNDSLTREQVRELTRKKDHKSGNKDLNEKLKKGISSLKKDLAKIQKNEYLSLQEDLEGLIKELCKTRDKFNN